MFEVVGQDIISGAMGFVGTDSDRLYRMGAAEKMEDVTVTGNPAVLDNATGKPFRDLHIYGRSEQMTTTGAQLLDFSDLIGKTETKNGATYKINEDQSVSVSGTPTKYTSFYLKGISLKAGSYCFIDNLKSSEIFVQLISKGNMDRNFTLTEDTDASVYVVFNVGENNTKTFDSTIKAMLNTGSTALPWEPYTGGKPSPSTDYPQEIQSAGDDGNLSVIVKNPDNEQMQSVSFSTPNGLPGIPVSVNGNYTDSNGQQWVCDELDFERGVYRQWIKHVNAVFHKAASSSTHSGYRHMTDDFKDLSREHTECLCNIAMYSKDAANGKEGVRASGGYNVIVLYYENLTNDNVPADVAYILSDSIETPLAASEIAACKSLRTYRGTTIVEARDKAGISATYKCNTKAAEKEVNILHADLMAEMEELDENSEIV